jgi:hypothetical protein
LAHCGGGAKQQLDRGHTRNRRMAVVSRIKCNAYGQARNDRDQLLFTCKIAVFIFIACPRNRQLASDLAP